MNETHSPLTSRELLAIFILLMLLFLGCTAAPQSTGTSPTMTAGVTQTTIATDPPPAPGVFASAVNWNSMTALPFDETIVNSLASLLSLVELPESGEKHMLVVDPVIDGRAGVQSAATRKVGAKLADLARRKYPHIALQPLSPAQLAQSPIVLFGTLTAVNADGYPEGKREAYRMCLTLGDLKSGRIVSKEIAKIQFKGVDHTPSRHFIESPAWMSEQRTAIHMQGCEESRVGEPISKQISDGIRTRALINEAIAHYESGRYHRALDGYSMASASAADNDLHVRNGLYLANLKLGRNDAAIKAFGNIVDFGMANDELAINFLFNAGSAVFPPDKRMYSSWLREIARRVTQTDRCLEVVGHTSPSGAEPLNQRLSLERAEYIKKLLETELGSLPGRVTARGAGSRENLVGTGKDDLSDSLDRRIVFRLVPCTSTGTQTAHR